MWNNLSYTFSLVSTRKKILYIFSVIVYIDVMQNFFQYFVCLHVDEIISKEINVHGTYGIWETLFGILWYFIDRINLLIKAWSLGARSLAFENLNFKTRFKPFKASWINPRKICILIWLFHSAIPLAERGRLHHGGDIWNRWVMLVLISQVCDA